MEFILPFALAAADGGLLRLMASLSTRCIFRSLSLKSLGIPLQKQRGLNSVSVGAKRVPLAYSTLAGQWKAELLWKITSQAFLC